MKLFFDCSDNSISEEIDLEANWKRESKARHVTSPRPPPMSVTTPPTPNGGESDTGRISPKDSTRLPHPSHAARPIVRESNDAASPPSSVKRPMLPCSTAGVEATTTIATSSVDPARPISSPAPMQNDYDYHYDHDDERPAHRSTLFATPTRCVGGIQNQNRSRAASCDIVLNISDDCLPRYCGDLAARIADISDVEATEENQRGQEHGWGQGQEQEQEPRQLVFTTPDRRASPANRHRGRANTCPHRPQRYSMVQRRGMHEETGWQMDIAPTSTPSFSTPGNLGAQPSPRDDDNDDGDGEELTPALSRRRHLSPPSPDIRHPATSFQLATPLLQTRTPPATRLPSQPRPQSPSDATSMTAPTVSGVNDLSSSTPGAVPVARPDPTSVPSQICLLRMHPALMKLLMVLNLYVLLAYSWNTDLKVRYKSMEINYGLSEYWHGEGGIHADSTNMRSLNHKSRQGEQLNNSGDGIIKLINELVENESVSEDTKDTIGEEEEVSLPTFESALTTDKNKRRPSLSYARSPASFQGAMRASASGAVRGRPSQPKWTLSKIGWYLVWMVFLLPIIEVAARKIRRQLNFRLRSVRLRSSRATLRVPNVHNL